MRRRGTSRSRTVAGLGRLRWSRRKTAAGSKGFNAIAPVNLCATLLRANDVQRSDLKKEKRPDARFQWLLHPQYLPPGKFPWTMYRVPSVAARSKEGQKGNRARAHVGQRAKMIRGGRSSGRGVYTLVLSTDVWMFDADTDGVYR